MVGMASGFTGSVCQLRSDWMGLKGVFSFGGWNAQRLCWKCRATQPGGDCPFDDVSKSAIWRTMRTSMSAFVSDAEKREIPLSPLLSLPGFLLSYIVIDVLHAVDLGVAQDVAGSFLYGCVFLGRGFLIGTTVDSRVQDLWSKIRKKVHGFQHAKSTTEAHSPNDS